MLVHGLTLDGVDGDNGDHFESLHTDLPFLHAYVSPWLRQLSSCKCLSMSEPYTSALLFRASAAIVMRT